MPLIEIAEPLDGGAALRRALARLDAFDWLVVTSANGAARVAAGGAAHPDVRLAAVGPATAAALADGAGRPVDLVAAVPQAEGLLAEFPPAPARVLLAQADRARRVLADGLAAAGHEVEAVAAYRTVGPHAGRRRRSPPWPASTPSCSPAARRPRRGPAAVTGTRRSPWPSVR